MTSAAISDPPSLSSADSSPPKKHDDNNETKQQQPPPPTEEKTPPPPPPATTTSSKSDILLQMAQDRAAAMTKPVTYEDIIQNIRSHTSNKMSDYRWQQRYVLLRGVIVTKIGRHGKPKQHVLTLDILGRLKWSPKRVDPRDFTAHTRSSILDLRKVVELRRGKETTNFQRSVAKEYKQELCLSLVTKDGYTLDMVAKTADERNRLYEACRSAVMELESGVVDMITGLRRLDNSFLAAPSAKANRRISMLSEFVMEHKRHHVSQSPASLTPAAGSAGSIPSLLLAEYQGKEADARLHRPDLTAIVQLMPKMTEKERAKFVRKRRAYLRFRDTGKPVLVFMSVVEDRELAWADTFKGQVKSSIPLEEAENVTIGRNTPVFRMQAKGQFSPDEQCFSIIFKTWTMDVQVESERCRDELASAYARTIQQCWQRRDNMGNNSTSNDNNNNNNNVVDDDDAKRNNNNNKNT